MGFDVGRDSKEGCGGQSLGRIGGYDMFFFTGRLWRNLRKAAPETQLVFTGHTETPTWMPDRIGVQLYGEVNEYDTDRIRYIQLLSC